MEDPRKIERVRDKNIAWNVTIKEYSISPLNKKKDNYFISFIFNLIILLKLIIKSK